MSTFKEKLPISMFVKRFKPRTKEDTAKRNFLLVSYYDLKLSPNDPLLLNTIEMLEKYFIRRRKQLTKNKKIIK